MLKYAFNPNPKKSAKAYGRGLRISKKNSQIICKEISGMNLIKGKSLLQGLVDQTRSLDGKYYMNAAKEILEIVKSAENNAEFKGMDVNKMVIHASAHKGFTFHRPRRFKMGRQKRKVAHIQVVLRQS
jgi:large subunit ribosomal protein L22